MDTSDSNLADILIQSLTTNKYNKKTTKKRTFNKILQSADVCIRLGDELLLDVICTNENYVQIRGVLSSIISLPCLFNAEKEGQYIKQCLHQKMLTPDFANNLIDSNSKYVRTSNVINISIRELLQAEDLNANELRDAVTQLASEIKEYIESIGYSVFVQLNYLVKHD